MIISASISQPYTASGYGVPPESRVTSGYEVTQGYGASKAAPQASPNAAPGTENPNSGTESPNQISDSVSRENTENTPDQSIETAPDGSRLTQEELKLVEDLKTADQEVRQHEMAHLAAGGSLVTSGAQYTYKTGPDGQKYAVAGEVGIDTSPVPGDPRATMEKMQQIKRAAMAPASPSAQDLKVAAKATATAAEAAGELTMLMAKQQASQDDAQAFGSARSATDAYQKVSTLPEEDTHSFQIAV